jgi:tetratricopeptide (TPR) repeat protein
MLQQMAGSGKLDSKCWVRREGTTLWFAAGTIAELFGRLQSGNDISLAADHTREGRSKPSPGSSSGTPPHHNNDQQVPMPANAHTHKAGGFDFLDPRSSAKCPTSTPGSMTSPSGPLSKPQPTSDAAKRGDKHKPTVVNVKNWVLSLILALAAGAVGVKAVRPVAPHLAPHMPHPPLNHPPALNAKLFVPRVPQPAQNHPPALDAKLFVPRVPQPAPVFNPVPAVPNPLAENVSTAYERGVASYGKRQFDQAFMDFNDAIRADPTMAVAYHGRACVWFVKKHYDQAINDCDEAIRFDPKLAIAYCSRGQARTAKQEYDKAIQDFNEAIGLEPRLAYAYLGRAAYWFAKGDFDQAINDYDLTIALNPAIAIAFCNRGLTRIAKLDCDRAIKDFDEAIRLDPLYAPAYGDRGNAWIFKQNYDKAINDFDEAIRLDPHFAAAYSDRGSAWIGKQNYDRAIKDCDNAIQLDPRFAPAFNNRGFAWTLKKDYGKAIKDFDEAIRLDPKNDMFHNDLAWILATCPSDQHRNGNRAIVLATKACDLTGWKSLNELDTLAAAYAEAGKFEDAVRLQERVVQDPDLDSSIASGCRQRLELYKQRKPYRDNQAQD